LWIAADGAPQLGTVCSDLRAIWPDGSQTAIELNAERRDNGAVLFTPRMGPSTRTQGGVELVLERAAGSRQWLPLRLGRTLTGRVRAVLEGGDAPIEPGTLVLSLGPDLPGARAIRRMASVGASVKLVIASTPDLSGVRTAIGGGPVLLHRGKQPAWGTGPQPRHPRTAVGWNGREICLIVVDGRRADLSIGMTLPELAALCQRLGCEEAINLDGGGSSTLWLDGRVMNVPSDGRERPVANGLVLLQAGPGHAH
jgi:hypothetical protein